MIALPPSKNDNGYVMLAMIVIFAVMIAVMQFPVPTQRALLAEGGLFESLSVAGYGLCIALMLVLWGIKASVKHWYFAVVLALFAARELDLDKIPFTEGLLKSRQYIGNTVAAPERAMSALVLLGIIATVVILLRHQIKPFWRALRARNAIAHAVLVGLVFIVLYKIVDGLARKLTPFGINLSESTNQILLVVEEIGELGIPVMFATAIWLSARRLAAQ